jgi:hypothetical protein
MAELDQLARPMMGRTAGFHTDKTLGQLGEEGLVTITRPEASMP